ncbi:hypothetical protein FQN52_005702 [Onygenales sp. PD_12]|nr:hypothetical protein FQN53_004772 [Emmonsiellopsis sp. PD_33]KAK2790207.1 hypothetical protein FQN52_005702 [Onygenales sp. PD_12]
MSSNTKLPVLAQKLKEVPERYQDCLELILWTASLFWGHRQDWRVYQGLHALDILNLMDDVFSFFGSAESEPFAPVVAPVELPPAPVASPPTPPAPAPGLVTLVPPTTQVHTAQFTEE